ncbi:MAG: 23S rRNA (adenine(2030)-N(6))-methyltransferase RlmJ [Treponema sp.]|nr:23S rRNA (adenine(2030)-N(6))-methyltransferase RlmJ [Treponema sp.]
MLSYRHAFHAGNHADLLKHSCLTLILSSLLKKDKAFTVFDTHGGGGLYQLDYQGLVHTGEAEKGILKLLEFAKQHPLPDSLQTYLELVKKYVTQGMYPGSPEISKAMMRQQDKLFVAELHNTEIEILRGNLSILDKEKNQTPSISIHHESGFSLLKSSLPPLVKRGLILMDPSYETDSDYQQPIQALSQAAKKWETAIIALWYPLLLHRSQQLDNMLCQVSEGFSLACRHNGDRKVITAELQIAPATEDQAAPRLYGSGMMILNCPYLLEEQLQETLPYLVQALSPTQGSWEVREWS